MDSEFDRIQEAAGIHLPCDGNHKHTPACHLYGFHGFRYAYGMLNADTMPAPVLQRKMRHSSFETTLRYIALADKMQKNADAVVVPAFLKTGTVDD